MTVQLQEIERALAPRVGPYRRVKVLSLGGTAPPTFVSNALKSTRERGDITEGMFVLRRGYLENGTAVPGFNTDDRVREVKTYVASTGTVTLDRDYAVAPAANEMVEFHHLHPDEELRTAVLEGLKRCYFLDDASVALASAAAERNLTTLVTWIVDASQFYGADYATTNTAELPRPVFHAQAIQKAAGVFLQTSPDPYPNTLRVIARRAHFTYVNAATLLTGPSTDTDQLAVDLPYAAAAGHIEAWRLYADRLADAAAEGRRATQREAAVEFTRQARDHFQPPPPTLAKTRRTSIFFDDAVEVVS